MAFLFSWLFLYHKEVTQVFSSSLNFVWQFYCKFGRTKFDTRTVLSHDEVLISLIIQYFFKCCFLLDAVREKYSYSWGLILENPEGGGGGHTANPFCGGGMDIFWNHTFLQIHMFRLIDRSLCLTYRTHAMNYLASLGIFMCQGCRMQR